MHFEVGVPPKLIDAHQHTATYLGRAYLGATIIPLPPNGRHPLREFLSRDAATQRLAQVDA
jgi:hypothetical protein